MRGSEQDAAEAGLLEVHGIKHQADGYMRYISSTQELL